MLTNQPDPENESQNRLDQLNEEWNSTFENVPCSWPGTTWQDVACDFLDRLCTERLPARLMTTSSIGAAASILMMIWKQTPSDILLPVLAFFAFIFTAGLILHCFEKKG